MRVTLDRAGKKTVVDVAADLSSATVNGHVYPVKVVQVSTSRVELEIAGERTVVEGWYEHFALPTGPVDVNGERWKVGVETAAEPAAPSATAPSIAPPAPGTRPTAAPVSAKVVPPPDGDGAAIVPPMPGKVVELRVKEGDRVHKGDVVLVLEAMKMRNEILAPVDGVVRYVRVSVGSNARAKEPMMLIGAA